MSAQLCPVRVCVADRHPLVLDALGDAFDRASGFEIVALCRTAPETFEAIESESPDVVIVDPLLGGVATAEIFRRAGQVSAMPIVFGDASWIPTLAHYPVLSKELSSEALIGAVRSIVRGRGPHAATMVEGLLSPREREALLYASRGLSNKEIAQRMGIAFGTVKVHLHAIFRKLGAKSRVELIRRAEGI